METKRHTWRTRQEIEVCQDCIYVSANGKPDYEEYANSGHFERYTEAVKTWGDEPQMLGVNTHYSHHRCDFCEGTPEGHRYSASLMQLHEEESVS